jgi:hypothetical protein
MGPVTRLFHVPGHVAVRSGYVVRQAVVEGHKVVSVFAVPERRIVQPGLVDPVHVHLEFLRADFSQEHDFPSAFAPPAGLQSVAEEERFFGE